MLKLWISCGVAWCSFAMVVCGKDAGPGLWHVQYLEKCEAQNHKLKIDLTQERINRTHEGWNGHISLEQAFDRGFSISIEIHQLVDGGYRLINDINEPEFIDFVLKCAAKNVGLVLEAAAINPPEFPISAGDYDIKEYIFDYRELDRSGFYGEFRGKVVLKSGLDEVFCVVGYVEFSEDEEEAEEKK